MGLRSSLARLALAALALGASGCLSLRMTLPVKPPPAALLELWTVPGSTDFADTPVGAKSITVRVHYLQEPYFTRQSLVTWGNADIEAAAARAGIETIHYVDFGVVSVLGTYAQLRVTVSGD